MHKLMNLYHELLKELIFADSYGMRLLKITALVTLLIYTTSSIFMFPKFI